MLSIDWNKVTGVSVCDSITQQDAPHKNKTEELTCVFKLAIIVPKQITERARKKTFS
jgi:predicted glycosyltransferase